MKAIDLSKNQIKNSNSKNSQRYYELLVDSYYGMGYCLVYMFSKLNAILYLDSAKILFDSIEPYYKDKFEAVNTKIKIEGAYAHLYVDAGEYDLALLNYQQVIKLKEDLIKQGKIDEVELAGDYFNFGLVQYYIGNYEKALDYYFKTLTITIQSGYKYGEAMCYNNIGIVYLEQNKTAEALKYFNKSLKLALDLEAITLVAQNYDNIGETYIARKNYEEAELFFLKSQEIALEIDNKQGLVFIKMNLAELYIELNKFNLAFEHANEALTLAKEISALSQIKSAYKVLSFVYEKMGNYKDALESYKQFFYYNDSIFNDEKNRQIEEMETKYQTEKKQQEIQKQKLELAKNQEVIKRKNVQRNFMIIAVLLVLLILFIVYRNYKAKVRINKELKEKNFEINMQKEEISTQAENLKSANEEITVQKQEIELKHKQIQASINYASRIQQAMMPYSDDFTRVFDETFILYKPKDIVSGDFYWFAEQPERYVFAAVDCTGHGVPGAFVSMLGISLLNEISAKNQFSVAADILEELRENIKNALHQKGGFEEQKEGMDIALCVIDKDKSKLSFSGANNPMYLIRNSELMILEATRSPISISINEKEFLNHNIDLKKNDIIYLFSDGYKDQFSENNQKLGSNNFKSLLIENSDKPLDKQKEILEVYFEKWKGQKNQIDDVLIIGIKV